MRFGRDKCVWSSFVTNVYGVVVTKCMGAVVTKSVWSAAGMMIQCLLSSDSSAPRLWRSVTRQVNQERDTFFVLLVMHSTQTAQHPACASGHQEGREKTQALHIVSVRD